MNEDKKGKHLEGGSARDRAAESRSLSAEEQLIEEVATEARKAVGVEGKRVEEGAVVQKQEEQDRKQEGEEEKEEEGLAMVYESQVVDLSDRLSRALAESENMRRRFERDKREALKYGASHLAMDLFEVADNMAWACGSVSAKTLEESEEIKNLVLGFTITEKSLRDVFSRHGISVIEAGVGDTFSVDSHQAVSQVESAEVAEGCIVEVLRKGYRMGERLLRPAQVVTAKKHATQAEEEKEITEKNNEPPNGSDNYKKE